MKISDSFDPTARTTNTFNAGFSGGSGRIIVYNESNCNLQISWGSSSEYCPCWTAMPYCVNNNNPNLNWSVQSRLVTTATPPISQVVIVAYDANEPIIGTFPASLIRQTNIGNTVSTALGGATSLQNDGNTSMVFIESTPSGAPSSTVSIDNQGNTTIKGNNAGTLTTLLQLIAGASPAVKLAAAAVLTECLGNLKADGTFESVGAAQLDSTLSVTGASSLDNGNIVTTGSGGVTSNNKFVLDGNQPTIFHSVNTGTTMEETGGANGVNIGRISTQSVAIISNLNSGGGVGFKKGGLNGTRLAEFKNSLDMTIAGSTYFTINGTPHLTGSGAYDSGFDLAEVFPVAEMFENGTVVCPGEDGLLHTCQHDGCAYAIVISKKPAFCAGGGQWDDQQETEQEQQIQPVALCGRLAIPTEETIYLRDWVTSNGKGGIRRMNPGYGDEYALGYALADSTPDGRVLIFLRSI